MKERVIGIIILLAGCTLAYVCVYKPLEDAKSGAESVSVSLKGAIILPITLVGFLFLIRGEKTKDLMGTREKPKPAATLICLLLALVGVGLYLWLRSTLEAHGYDFKGKF